MKPTLCSRCKKNLAVIFITKVENGQTTNEGLCLKCAKEMGIKQVDEIVERMGITDEDLDTLNGEMMSLMQPEESEDEDDIGSRTATFPHMNRLFGGQNEVASKEEPKEKQPKGEKPQAKKHKFLDTYCQNLTAKAKNNELDKVIGREVETERVVQILNRRQKNNPCLIGEPGVGKTAIAEGLAQRIAAGDVPFKLRDKQVYLLDLTSLVAGTQFRGQFEGRMKSLIAEVKACGNVILVIDEVHNLVGAGDAEGSMSAANILKPALSRGEIQVIGATTFAEYRKYIEKDAALERRFQPVTVNEPSMEDTLKILKGIAHYYESFHGVKIPDGILRQAVVLSERYITDRFLPDKAIDLLDEACSDLNLHSKEISDLAEKRKERDDYQLEIKMLTEDTEQQDNFERLAKLRSNVCRLDAEIAELEAAGLGQKDIFRLQIGEKVSRLPAGRQRVAKVEPQIDRAQICHGTFGNDRAQGDLAGIENVDIIADAGFLRFDLAALGAEKKAGFRELLPGGDFVADAVGHGAIIGMYGGLIRIGTGEQQGIDLLLCGGDGNMLDDVTFAGVLVPEGIAVTAFAPGNLLQNRHAIQQRRNHFQLGHRTRLLEIKTQILAILYYDKF